MFPSIIAGGFSLLLASAGDVTAHQVAEVQPPPAAVVASSPQIPLDAFPTKEMAEQFAAYLAWTKAQGLSRLAAFESLPAEQVHFSPNLSAQRSLPTPEMAEQFNAYLSWTRSEGLSRFHAFQVSDFN
jgi:hypothetical protein